jgi:hypothetical protein
VPPNVYYGPVAGTLTLTDTNPGCSLSVTSVPITANNSSFPYSTLYLDPSKNPPFYVGFGGTYVSPLQEICPPSPSVPRDASGVYIWFTSPGQNASPDGSTLQGSFSAGGASSTWNFTGSK